ncbi:MAG: hypothetical protein AB7F96_03160 [Beijerinckiaceae bacterium]
MVNPLTRSAARIYGTLSALGNGAPDVLERLLPFFDPILRPKNGMRFDLAAFAQEIRDTYKWNFNTDIVEVFVPRLCDAGWLLPDNPNIPQTTYTISMPEEDASNDDNFRVIETLRQIAEQFKNFSEVLSPLTAIPRLVEEFEEILIEWLIFNEAFSEHNVKFKNEFRKDETGTLRQLILIPETTSLGDEEQFLCARFVQHAIKEDPSTAEVLAKIASIGLLTEVVQDFVKPNNIVERTNLILYLDAPVALELLGVSGKAARENIQPIVSELQNIGAQIRIFEQSVEELKNSLQAVLQNPHPTGPTAQALARGDVLRDYVSEVARAPEPFLEELGLRVTHRSLDQFPNEHEYFTEEQRDELFGALTFQQNLRAREHDADIATLVMRQRRGIQERDIFRSRYLIVTRNGLLAQLVQKKCKELGALSTTAVPPIVHRRVIAAAIWLRTGLGAQNFDLPKRMLLATCERVLAIRPGVVEAVKKITKALGDEEKSRQLDLLIRQDRSTQMLMDKTLGAPGVVTEENIAQLFQDMLHPHLEEERKQSRENLKEAMTKERKKRNKISAELETLKKDNEEAISLLDASMEEDHKVIETLASEVCSTLAFRRKLKKFLGLGLAVVFCAPPFINPSVWQTYLSVLLAIPITYLTITGSKLIGIETSEKDALEKLGKIAEERRLDKKLSEFSVSWVDNRFLVSAADGKSKS